VARRTRKPNKIKLPQPVWCLARFYKNDATEQVNKRMNDLTTTNLNQRQFFENKFREFKEYLEQRGNLKALAVRTLLTPVASFFSRNGLSLNLKHGDWESTYRNR
jgi:hypothetical protein